MNALKTVVNRGTALRLLLVAVVGFSLPAFSADEAPGAGKWRVVNYWSEWCAPCRIEIPMLNVLSQELSAQGVAVVGVNFDEDPRALTLEIAEELEIEFPVLTNEEVARLGLRPPDVLPTTYLLAPDGEVVAKLIGMQTDDEIRQQLVTKGALLDEDGD